MQAALLLGVVGAAAAVDGRMWCAAPAIKEWPRLDAKAGVEFRGGFRDMALFVHDKVKAPAHCTVFMNHTKANDGLWVLEYDMQEDMEKAMQKARSLGLGVVYRVGLSFVLQGGGKVPDAMGLDACGAELHMRVISVSHYNIRAAKPYTAEQIRLYKQRLQDPNQRIETAIQTVTQTAIKGDIEHLEEYHSRNSFKGSELGEAMQWVSSQFGRYGAVNTTAPATKAGDNRDFYDMVVAEFKGETSDIIVAGAHADSRSTRVNDEKQRAPGADDNGSGTAALLAIARAISALGLKFKKTIRLVSFTGEEQGLVGSRTIATKWKDEEVPIKAMVNGDMLGYKRPNGPIALAFMTGHAHAGLTQRSKDIVKTYLPQLEVGDTSGCCSDQQSFNEAGFEAVGLFEHPGTRVEYPQYHKSDDLLRQLSMEQLVLEIQAMLAIVMELAEPL